MTADHELVVALLGYTGLYAAQHFLGESLSCRSSRWPRPAAEVFVRKGLGGMVLLLGAAVLALVLPEPPSAYGLRVVPTLRDGAWIVAAGLPILALVATSATLGAEDPVRPEIRLPSWSTELLLVNAGAWAIYLLGYEAALRGLVLSTAARAFGAGPAIAVNLAVYVLLHLPKGLRETAVSVPFGLLACAAALDTGSVWAPFLLHLIASVTNDTIRARRFAR